MIPGRGVHAVPQSSTPKLVPGVQPGEDVAESPATCSGREERHKEDEQSLCRGSQGGKLSYGSFGSGLDGGKDTSLLCRIRLPGAAISDCRAEPSKTKEIQFHCTKTECTCSLSLLTLHLLVPAHLISKASKSRHQKEIPDL